MSTMKFNVALLAICQALANTNNTILIALGALVGFSLADNKVLANSLTVGSPPRIRRDEVEASSVIRIRAGCDGMDRKPRVHEKIDQRAVGKRLVVIGNREKRNLLAVG